MVDPGHEITHAMIEHVLYPENWDILEGSAVHGTGFRSLLRRWQPTSTSPPPTNMAPVAVVASPGPDNR